MILLVKDDNGEQWEDYDSWVESVYDIQTDKTADQLHDEWKQHVAKAMADQGITVNPTWVHQIMEDTTVKKVKTGGSKHLKLHKKILKENSFVSWLEATYKANKLTFGEIHPVK